MREIKFRGIDLYKNKWVYGSLVIDKQPSMHFYYILCFITKPLTMVTQIDASTTGQYTGLKDKNGKEIYEGDIVVWHIDNEEKIAKVFYAKQVGKFMIKVIEDNNCYDFKDIQTNKQLEVIGNIYENEEMVE